MEDPEPAVRDQAGGVEVNSGTTNVSGDVVGRDKTISVQAPGATIIINEEKRTPPDERTTLLKSQKIPVSIWVAVLGAGAVILAALITAIVGPIVVDRINHPPMPPPSTPSCISAEDIIVTFHIFKGKNEIAALSSGDTLSIEPDSTVYLQAEMMPVKVSILPPLDCIWTNTGIATEGKLLHNAGCKIDYRSGHEVVADAVSLQLSQPSCSALAPYPFFILPKP